MTSDPFLIRQQRAAQAAFQGMDELMQTLVERPIVEPTQQPQLTVRERFERFHQTNPQVYTALVQLALQLKRRGVAKYGVKALFETLRFHYALHTQGERFKLNNYFTSFYARLMMINEPELDGFFETRRMRVGD